MFCTQCGNSALDSDKFCAKCGAALITPVVKVPDPRRPPPLPSQRSDLSAAPGTGTGTAPGHTRAAFSPIVYASIGRRLGAFAIDVMLIGVLYAITSALLHSNIEHQAFGPLVLLAFIAWPYLAFLESSPWQASFGKRALGIKVTSRQGERISFWRATGRAFAQVLSQLSVLLGYLMAGFTKRRQTLHDLLAGTLVVQQDATPAEIALSAPAPRGEGIATVAIIAVVAMFVSGILAAIAIPAYQDYTIRRQVMHGISLAEPYKVAVTEALAAGTNSFNINSGQGGTIAPNVPASGTYEDLVGVITGNILVVYGKQANHQLQNRHLYIYVIQHPNGTLTWVCGRSVPIGEEMDPSVRSFLHLTNVQDKYLPTSCRR